MHTNGSAVSQHYHTPLSFLPFQLKPVSSSCNSGRGLAVHVSLTLSTYHNSHCFARHISPTHRVPATTVQTSPPFSGMIHFAFICAPVSSVTSCSSSPCMLRCPRNELFFKFMDCIWNCVHSRIRNIMIFESLRYGLSFYHCRNHAP